MNLGGSPFTKEPLDAPQELIALRRRISNEAHDVDHEEEEKILRSLEDV